MTDKSLPPPPGFDESQRVAFELRFNYRLTKLYYSAYRLIIDVVIHIKFDRVKNILDETEDFRAYTAVGPNDYFRISFVYA